MIEAGALTPNLEVPMFTGPGTWAGGSYELALEYPPGDDELLTRALLCLWSAPVLSGCYRERPNDPDDEPTLDTAAGRSPLDAVL